jgi:hypothetical protein
MRKIKKIYASKSYLQNQLLGLFKKKYPDMPLKEIAKNSDIQITRVFRLLNGSEMKITEYESFIGLLEMQYPQHILLLLAFILSRKDQKNEGFHHNGEHSLVGPLVKRWSSLKYQEGIGDGN